ncbi:VPS5 [[Candida] subhashii]|uniref:VPS5 n=1 Tax=[Candida] subhashii TaxID=561895 RepID=A0A8J5QGH2_9ASCO|nr:VPS5 [[Candida] subhashii]KAG7661719.1 VPS5 [[Candida] subhashii]
MDNEDLTASHWDDVLSPRDEFASTPTGTTSNTNNSTNLHSSMIAPLGNQFNSLSMDDPFASPMGFGSSSMPSASHFGDYRDDYADEDDENDDEDDERQQQQQGEAIHTQNDFYNAVQAENEQQEELRKEERKEHKNQLLSELTQGSEERPLMLESSVISPQKVTPSESLFNDKGSPIKINKQDQMKVTSPSKPINIKHSQFKATRPRKFTSKINVKHLNTEGSNPLGPLGKDENKDDDKSSDNSPISSVAASMAQEIDAPLYNINPADERLHATPKIKKKTPTSDQPKATENVLDISVGDPMKIGDITNAHIVYTIKTRNKNLESPNFPQNDTTEVTRRYRDFRWIYHQLQNNHPGKIIPPPPSKQTYIGRFNENFIENRRLSLEKMLSKISHIPILCNDPDFVMFLVSDDFINESRERERLSGSGASTQNSESLDGAGGGGGGTPGAGDNDSSSSTGSLSGINVVGGGGSGAGGFMSSLFSMSTRINEPDEFFIERKQYIEDLEYNLKQFYKAIEVIGQQRADMVVVLDEISLTLDELSALEISKVTSELLAAFSDIQLKIKDNLDRINLQDQLTLGFTIEEYLRIIGSIKFVFETRMKIYTQYYNFNQELIKKQGQLDKLERKYNRAQYIDKINSLTFEVDKLKQKTSTFEINFKTISETIKQELENFEFERIDDFRNSVEIFIESSIESQKEAIELYETFYERQHLGDV